MCDVIFPTRRAAQRFGKRMQKRCRVGSRVCLTQSNAGSTLLLLGPDAARQESPNACISSTKECRFTAVDPWHLSNRFRKVFQRASQAQTPFNSMTYSIPDSITIRQYECAWRAAQLSRLSVRIGSGEGASPPQSPEECRFTAVDSFK